MMSSREGAWRKTKPFVKDRCPLQKMLLISVIKGSSVVTILLF